MLDAQPMQVIAKERRDVSYASVDEDEPRGRAENNNNNNNNIVHFYRASLCKSHRGAKDG